MVKQYIVARKDLPMSAGKLAAQVSHASLAFLPWMMMPNIVKTDDDEHYEVNNLKISKEMWEGWLDPEHASFTKIVLGVKNKNQLCKVVEMAKEHGLVENRDFFCIHDAGRTELDEYRDEDGTIFTCIGFVPQEEENLKPILGKLQVYRKKEA